MVFRSRKNFKAPLLPWRKSGRIKLMPVSLPACNHPRNSQTAPAGIDYHGLIPGWNSLRDLCVGRLRPEKINRLNKRGESRAGLTLPTAPPMPRAGMTERETEKSVGIGSLSDTAHMARQNRNIRGVRQDGPKGFFAFKKTGRSMTSRIPGRPGHVVGSKHHKAKLTEADIPVIRKLHDEGVSTRALAEKYDVTQRAIYQVVAFISWRHVL